MVDPRRRDWRRRSRYGTGNLVLETVTAAEVPAPVFDIPGNWMPLLQNNERVVSTDVEPSRGRIDWVFWIAADQIPAPERMEKVKYATFNGERYEIQSKQFFEAEPAHWELLAIRMALEPVIA
jgi:hypothetical protein